MNGQSVSPRQNVWKAASIRNCAHFRCFKPHWCSVYCTKSLSWLSCKLNELTYFINLFFKLTLVYKLSYEFQLPGSPVHIFNDLFYIFVNFKLSKFVSIKWIVKKYVSFKLKCTLWNLTYKIKTVYLVIIRVDYFEVFLSISTSTLVLVQTENWLKHTFHFKSR